MLMNVKHLAQCLGHNGTFWKCSKPVLSKVGSLATWGCCALETWLMRQSDRIFYLIEFYLNVRRHMGLVALIGQYRSGTQQVPNKC